MIKVSVIGASGYTGMELLRLLLRHPEVELVHLTSRKLAGEPIAKEFPWMKTSRELFFCDVDPDKLAQNSDFIISALPHQASMDIVAPLSARGVRVIDLSADFRFRDVSVYETWYHHHTAPEQSRNAVYGLPEFYREEIKKAGLLANPGCYTTCSILALAPFLKEGLLEPQGIAIDAKSGCSGAGRTPRQDLLFCEVNEGFRAYNTGIHRHNPEIEEQLTLISGHQVTALFSPHLLPINRGILATSYAVPQKPVNQSQLYEVLNDYYGDEPFVRIFTDILPNTAYVRGTNYCDIAVRYNERNNRVVVLSALDNLVKGASGQAVQNLNIMAGLRETLGLEQQPIYP